MAFSKADLHVHTYHSDGEDSPVEIVRKAKKVGLKYVSITDHNTVEGIEKALLHAKKLGVVVIPGVEIASRDGEILGYFVDYKNPDFRTALRKAAYSWHESTKRKISELNKMGFNISLAKFVKFFPYSKHNYNPGHLVLYFTKILGYSREEAVKIINSIKYKKSKQKELTTIQAIRLVKRFGGVPVLAHPWINTLILKEDVISKLTKHGLRGIEEDNGEGYDKLRTKKVVSKVRRLAKKFNLILTKGSDYHGESLVKESKHHQLGKCVCDEKTVKLLNEYRRGAF